jgi:hypothetical protein
MTDFRDMRETDLDRLLAGDTPPGAEGAAGLAAFARALKVACPEKGAPDAVQAAQIEACVAASQELAVGGEPALRRSRRRPLRLVLKVACVSAAFLLLFCGLALAGALPPSIEGPVSRAALRIGVHLPSPAPSVTPVRAQDPSSSPTQTADPSPAAKAHQPGDPTPKAQSHPTPNPSHSPAQEQSGVQPSSGSSGQSGGGGQDGDDTSSAPADDEQDPPVADHEDQDPPEADETPPPDEQDPPSDEQDPPSDPGTHEESDVGGSGN